MWIFTKHGFYSVVEDRDNADLLLVRARVEGDIEKYFRDAVVYYTPEHDYAYRAHVSRREVAAVMAQTVLGVDYPNFKSGIADHRRGGFYVQIWNILWDMQRALKGA
jgi:hypothetical protein